jgi:transposase
MVAACRQPGISIASVALAHGLNANLLRRWIIEHERATSLPPQVAKVIDATPPEHASSFVPVTVTPTRDRDENIRVELRRGATTVSVIWPISVAADCVAWMRELLR